MLQLSHIAPKPTSNCNPAMHLLGRRSTRQPLVCHDFSCDWWSRNMSVRANTGDAFLDAYARQVNALEAQARATSSDTPGYDAGLEKQFEAVKAQYLGAHKGGAEKRSCGSPVGSPGLESPTARSQAAGSGSGAATPSVPDSIKQIASAGGLGAAATVQGIVNGNATGGSVGI